MRYAQHKSGQKLHLVYEYNNIFSQPICGKIFDSLRMTINVPLGHSCKNCLRISKETASKKENNFLSDLTRR